MLISGNILTRLELAFEHHGFGLCGFNFAQIFFSFEICDNLKNKLVDGEHSLEISKNLKSYAMNA
jgi:hypothetical protein